MMLPARVAQANADAGGGLFIHAGFGTMLEGRGSAPLAVTGDALAVEAGALFPGGTIFQWEVGLRGFVLSPTAAAPARVAARELSAFFGVRLELMRDPELFGFMPAMRAGFRAGLARDRLFYRRPPGGARLDPVLIIADDRAMLGPHFAFLLERELWFGTTLSLSAGAHATIAPLTMCFTLAIGVSAQALP